MSLFDWPIPKKLWNFGDPSVGIFIPNTESCTSKYWPMYIGSKRTGHTLSLAPNTSPKERKIGSIGCMLQFLIGWVFRHLFWPSLMWGTWSVGHIVGVFNFDGCSHVDHIQNSVQVIVSFAMINKMHHKILGRFGRPLYLQSGMHWVHRTKAIWKAGFETREQHALLPRLRGFHD